MSSSPRIVPLAAVVFVSLMGSASAADTVTGTDSPPGWKESVGRTSFRPSTPFTLIESFAVLYDRCCRSRP